MARTAMLVAGATLLSISLGTPAALAQSNGAAQVTANRVTATVFKNDEESEKALSSEAVRDQLKAQQQEINDLRERIKKLEALLEAIAANQPKPASAILASEVGRSLPATEIAANTGAPSNHSFASESPINTEFNPVSPSASSVRPQASSRKTLSEDDRYGASYGLLIGGSTNPFVADSGSFIGGFFDLPFKKLPSLGGELSYEFMFGLQRTTTQNQQVTSGFFAVVNKALSGNFFSPLPVTLSTEERMKILTFVPFSLKYTMTKFEKHRFRPYGIVGAGTYVTITSQNTKGFDAGKFIPDPALAGLANALLNGPLLGGLVPGAPELRARSLPLGVGDVRFGVNFGGGFEYRLSPAFSIGLDYRGNKVEGRNSFFSTIAFKPTFHF